MAPSPARKPHFLSGVPDVPVAVPARFAPASQRGVLPGPVPRSLAHAAAPEAPSAPSVSAADLEAIRRDALDRVDAAVEMLRAQADRLAEGARADAIEIAFQVARKILEIEIRQSPEALFALVRSAVRRAGDSRRVAIRLAPDDAAALQSEVGKAALEGVTAARIEIVADPGLSSGDCVVDTDFGQVDGRLSTRLSEIRRAVDGVSGEEEAA